MKRVCGRIGINLIWIAIAVVIVILLASLVEEGYQINWHSAWSWVLGSVFGVIIGERHMFWRLIMGLIKAIRHIMEQESNPKKFVWPVIRDIDFFPEPIKGIDLDYIILKLGWVNTMSTKATIENISGEISIDGTYPPDEFTTKEAIKVPPYTPLMNMGGIIIKPSGSLLPCIKNIRTRRFAKGSVKIDLSVDLNGRRYEDSLSESYKYVE